MPDVGIQVPPNLADWWPRLVAAGATDLGGLSANGDHISPEHPFPSPHQVRKRLAQDGVALTERLCVYPRFIDPEWLAQGVLDVIKTRYWSFIPRRGSGRVDGPEGRARPDTLARARAPAARSTPASSPRCSPRRAPEVDRGHAPGRRRAARRAGRRHGDVRRQPQHQRLERLHRRLRVLRLRPGPALAGRLHARARRVRRADRATRSTTARPRSASSRASTPTGTLEDYEGWLRLAKDEAPRAPPARLLARWRSRTCATCSGLPPREVFARLRDAGLGSVPGTAAEVLARRRARADQPEQAAGRALGRDHRGRARAPGCARPSP